MKTKRLLASAAVLAAGALAAACSESGPAVAIAGPRLNAAPTGPADSVLVSFTSGQGLTLTGRLYIPSGSGPFRAVVAMHGCSGLYYNNKISSEFDYWGKRLKNEEQTVTLFIDSFGPRNITGGVCNDDSKINEAVDRVWDAYAGLEYLRTLPYVADDRVAILGWSNGGSATLSAAARDDRPVALPAAGGFRTAISFYPGCWLRNQYGNPSTGTYIPYVPVRLLIGSLDSFKTDCQNRTDRAVALGASAATGNAMTIKVYTGAQHGFNRAKTGDAAWTTADVAARDSSRVEVINIVRGI